MNGGESTFFIPAQTEEQIILRASLRLILMQAGFDSGVVDNFEFSGSWWMKLGSPLPERSAPLTTY